MDLLKPVSAWFSSLTSRLTTRGSRNEGGKARVCRICLADGVDSETGRLFSPCRCSGTNGSVHENCLRVWRQSAHDRKHWSSCGTCGFEYCYYWRPGKARRFVKRRFILSTFLIYLVLSIGAGFLATAWLRWHEEYLLRATSKALENLEPATPTKTPGESSWNPLAGIGAILGDCTWVKRPSLGSGVSVVDGGFSYGDEAVDPPTPAGSYCLGSLLHWRCPKIHALAVQLWSYRFVFPKYLPLLTNGNVLGLLPRSHCFHFAYVTATIVYSFYFVRNLLQFYLARTAKKARMLDFSETVEAKQAGKTKGA
ncbi:E3 ubiquitin-protein ligase march2 [Rhodosporidiobolus nylandii]